MSSLPSPRRYHDPRRRDRLVLSSERRAGFREAARRRAERHRFERDEGQHVTRFTFYPDGSVVSSSRAYPAPRETSLAKGKPLFAVSKVRDREGRVLTHYRGEWVRRSF